MSDLRILEVHYIGRAKERENKTVSAFGWVGGEWRAIFPEKVLRAWFEDEPAAPDQPKTFSTHYAVLGITAKATSDELKTAYRRMVKQWHPDVCRDPSAHEVFLKVQNAYALLSDPGKKARYDAGLMMEASVRKSDPLSQQAINKMAALDPYGYRSPLKSGLICAEVKSSGRWVVVENIMAWEDVSDTQGRVLIASWPMGSKQPVEVWA